MDNYRKDILKKYPNIDQFKKNYVVDEKILAALKSEAENEKIEFKEEEYERSKPLIIYQIKGLMARDLYDMEAYFKIANEESEIFKKALEIIKDDKLYNGLLKGNRDDITQK